MPCWNNSAGTATYSVFFPEGHPGDRRRHDGHGKLAAVGFAGAGLYAGGDAGMKRIRGLTRLESLDLADTRVADGAANGFLAVPRSSTA